MAVADGPLVYRYATKEWLVEVCHLYLQYSLLELTEIQVGMKRPYLDEYHATVEPLFIKPKEINILNRTGGKLSVVKEDNGHIWPEAKET